MSTQLKDLATAVVAAVELGTKAHVVAQLMRAQSRNPPAQMRQALPLAPASPVCESTGHTH